jgi:D-amino-acid dehydrogenase
LPPAYALAAGPWLWRFFRASTPARFRKSLEAQAALMALARRETLPFLERAGLAEEIVSHGALTLYESEKSFEAARAEWAHRDPYGIRYAHLDRAGIEARQPGLSPRFRHATFIEDWPQCPRPACAGQILERSRHRPRRNADHRPGHRTGRHRRRRHNHPRKRLQTPGPHRDPCRRRLVAPPRRDDRRPRAARNERGYNTTLPRDAFDLNCQLIFSEHGFVVSPLGVGIRVGGAVELAGLARKPDYRRSRVMLDKTKAFLPALKTDGGTQWMGFRPSLPDSLPVIGRSSNAKNVIHAFGHGHLGLTQSAATARLVADLVANANPAIDLAPFSPARF